MTAERPARGLPPYMPRLSRTLQLHSGSWTQFGRKNWRLRSLPMNLNRAVCLEERPLSLDAGCRAERLRFRRMIFAGRNGILNNGGTPRKGASALHAEAIANTATAFRFMDSIRAKKLATAVSPASGRG